MFGSLFTILDIMICGNPLFRFRSVRMGLNWMEIMKNNPYVFLVDAECTPNYGRLVGPLGELQHGVRGMVYVVDEFTVRIREFSYDGLGPC